MSALHRRRQKFSEIDLYPVTSAALSAGRTTRAIVEGVLAGGAKIVQLREKEASKRALYELAWELRPLTEAAGALLIINDHLDVALAVNADGVHLGQDDLPCRVARRLAPELLIGVSTHNREQALRAEADGADYVNIGPLFPTQTKSTAYTPLGFEGLDAMAPALKIPFTVMGGIKREHLADLVAHGATRIALVTAVTQALDVAGATRELRSAILAAKPAAPPKRT